MREGNIIGKIKWERIGALGKGGDRRALKVAALSCPALAIISPLWVDWCRLQSPSGLQHRAKMFSVLKENLKAKSDSSERSWKAATPSQSHDRENQPGFLQDNSVSGRRKRDDGCSRSPTGATNHWRISDATSAKMPTSSTTLSVGAPPHHCVYP